MFYLHCIEKLVPGCFDDGELCSMARPQEVVVVHSPKHDPSETFFVCISCLVIIKMLLSYCINVNSSKLWFVRKGITAFVYIMKAYCSYLPVEWLIFLSHLPNLQLLVIHKKLIQLNTPNIIKKLNTIQL